MTHKMTLKVISLSPPSARAPGGEAVPGSLSRGGGGDGHWQLQPPLPWSHFAPKLTLTGAAAAKSRLSALGPSLSAMPVVVSLSL